MQGCDAPASWSGIWNALQKYRPSRLKGYETITVAMSFTLAKVHVYDYWNVNFTFQPENVLMIDDDTIKLTDFGFAYELAPGEKLYGAICNYLA